MMEQRNNRWVVKQVSPVAVPGDKPLVTDKEKGSDVIYIDAFLGISPDFSTYATGHQSLALDSYVVEIVDVKSREILASLNCGQGWRNSDSVAFGKDSVAVFRQKDGLGLYGDVRILSLKSGELVQDIHNHRIRDMAFTADGRFLVVTEARSGKGYYLVVYDVETKKLIAELDLGGNGYYSLAVTGNYAAVYEMESDRILVVEAATGKLVKQFNAGSIRKRKAIGSRRMPLSISPEGNLLACGVDGKVFLYNIGSNRVVRQLDGHPTTVWLVSFSPNGKIIASVAQNQTIRFWNVKQGEAVRVFNLPSRSLGLLFSRIGGIGKLIFTADGNRIAVVNLRLHKAGICNLEPK